MKMLALEDLKGMEEKAIISHLVSNYAGSEREQWEVSDAEKKTAEEKLKGMKVLIAYESVGDYGCDSSSFYLLKKGKNLFEVHGSHCSCYGFEGQLQLEPTTVKALQKRAETNSVFSTGGYDKGGWDDKKNSNVREVNVFIAKLK